MFDGEGTAYDAIMEGKLKPGQVMVIRYEGPKGRYGYDTGHSNIVMVTHMLTQPWYARDAEPRGSPGGGGSREGSGTSDGWEVQWCFSWNHDRSCDPRGI